jgi:hypothetical protein
MLSLGLSACEKRTNGMGGTRDSFACVVKWSLAACASIFLYTLLKFDAPALHYQGRKSPRIQAGQCLSASTMWIQQVKGW